MVGFAGERTAILCAILRRRATCHALVLRLLYAPASHAAKRYFSAMRYFSKKPVSESGLVNTPRADGGFVYFFAFAD